MSQGSVSQRPGHSSLHLVPESLQEPLSHQLGGPLHMGSGTSDFYSQISTFSSSFLQVQKWDEQLEAGSFPGKI